MIVKYLYFFCFAKKQFYNHTIIQSFNITIISIAILLFFVEIMERELPIFQLKDEKE